MSNSVEGQISEINRKLNQLADGLTKEMRRNKTIKRKAARILEAAMYLNTPKAKYAVKRNGKTIQPRALRKSIKILNLRKSSDVFVGSDFRIAPHAHLVEFGFNHYKAGAVPGKYFARRSYDQTKELVLKSLVDSAAKEFEKHGKRLEIGQ